MMRGRQMVMTRDAVKPMTAHDSYEDVLRHSTKWSWSCYGTAASHTASHDVLGSSAASDRFNHTALDDLIACVDCVTGIIIARFRGAFTQQSPSMTCTASVPRSS